MIAWPETSSWTQWMTRHSVRGSSTSSRRPSMKLTTWPAVCIRIPCRWLRRLTKARQTRLRRNKSALSPRRREEAKYARYSISRVSSRMLGASYANYVPTTTRYVPRRHLCRLRPQFRKFQSRPRHRRGGRRRRPSCNIRTLGQPHRAGPRR